MNASPVIAVTGLHRGENPQPGSAVIRSLRRVYPELRIIGLVYDSLESGLFSEEDAPDAAFTMSYPGAGEEAFWQRLDAIREIERFDVLIPCLDAEMGPLVDCTNHGMRHRASKHLGDQHPWEPHIVHVVRAPGDLVTTFYSQGTRPNPRI